jgi:hypothetical protein
MLPWMSCWFWGTGSCLGALAKQPCAPEIAKAPDEYYRILGRDGHIADWVMCVA